MMNTTSLSDYLVNAGFLITFIGGTVWTFLFLAKNPLALRISSGAMVFPAVAGYGAVGGCLVIEQAGSGTASSLVGLRLAAAAVFFGIWGFQLIKKNQEPPGVPGKASPWIGAGGLGILAIATLLSSPAVGILIACFPSFWVCVRSAAS